MIRRRSYRYVPCPLPPAGWASRIAPTIARVRELVDLHGVEAVAAHLEVSEATIALAIGPSGCMGWREVYLITEALRTRPLRPPVVVEVLDDAAVLRRVKFGRRLRRLDRGAA